MINILKTNIYNLFQEAIEQRVFPGATMGIAVGWGANRQRLVLAHGHTDYSRKREVRSDTVYDLASLTKPLVTVLSLLCLIKQGKLTLSQRLGDIFSQVPTDKHGITIANLLGHCSGLPAHRPYFQTLVEIKEAERQKSLFSMIMDDTLEYETGERTVYSDLGFMLLGLVVETVSGQDLASFFRKQVASPLHLEESLFFQPPFSRASDLDRYAVMEECAMRGTVVHGSVSDENAWALGGVAGHAGLFGTIDGVLDLCVHLLDQWQGREEHARYRASDLAQLLQRQNIPGSTWALGFDTPSESGSSGGRYLSPSSVGHLGFTGTSFWIDPSRDLVMVLLSNRVHPSRENDKIKQFRPRFHDLVLEGMGLL
ncbi:MAG: serine hydrolase domain-containing protein [Thermodesulfobacteriota bacterium]